MTHIDATDWERAREALGPEETFPVPGYLARGMAFAIDLALIAMLIFVIELVLGLALTLLAIGGAIPAVPLGGPWTQPAREVFDSPGVVAIRVGAIGLGLAYLPWFWARGGQTPAMSFLGMRLTADRDPGVVGFRTAVVRFVALVVSIVSVVGVLWALVDPKRRGWHDIVAGTIVIAE